MFSQARKNIGPCKTSERCDTRFWRLNQMRFRGVHLVQGGSTKAEVANNENSIGICKELKLKDAYPEIETLS